MCVCINFCLFQLQKPFAIAKQFMTPLSSLNFKICSKVCRLGLPCSFQRDWLLISLPLNKLTFFFSQQISTANNFLVKSRIPCSLPLLSAGILSGFEPVQIFCVLSLSLRVHVGISSVCLGDAVISQIISGSFHLYIFIFP